MIGDFLHTKRLDPVGYSQFSQARSKCLKAGGQVRFGGQVCEETCPACNGALITLELVTPGLKDSQQFDQCVQCFRFYPLKPIFETVASRNMHTESGSAEAARLVRSIQNIASLPPNLQSLFMWFVILLSHATPEAKQDLRDHGFNI